MTVLSRGTLAALRRMGLAVVALVARVCTGVCWRGGRSGGRCRRSGAHWRRFGVFSRCTLRSIRDRTIHIEGAPGMGGTVAWSQLKSRWPIGIEVRVIGWQKRKIGSAYLNRCDVVHGNA